MFTSTFLWRVMKWQQLRKRHPTRIRWKVNVKITFCAQLFAGKFSERNFHLSVVNLEATMAKSFLLDWLQHLTITATELTSRMSNHKFILIIFVATKQKRISIFASNKQTLHFLYRIKFKKIRSKLSLKFPWNIRGVYFEHFEVQFFEVCFTQLIHYYFEVGSFEVNHRP